MANRDAPPTTKQVYALCRALLQESGRPWPGTRAEASALIARLRGEPQVAD
ncbi:MAG: hypothetical protein M3141_01000 [Actinomycetota bacterium]|nr:hypothetical protein [Actinomycetota bacterium]